jgi:hypothetical protein
MALDFTCLQTRKAKTQVGELGLRSARASSPPCAGRRGSTRPASRRLRQEAAGDRLDRHARRCVGVGQPAGQQQRRRFFLPASTASAASSRIRAR